MQADDRNELVYRYLESIGEHEEVITVSEYGARGVHSVMVRCDLVEAGGYRVIDVNAIDLMAFIWKSSQVESSQAATE